VRRTLTALTIVVVAAFWLGSAAEVALAESPVTVDCVAHSKLTKHYSVSQLQNALNTMPAEVQEYDSECYQLIEAQLNEQQGSSHVTGTTPTTTASSSGSSFLSAPLLIALAVVVVVGGGFVIAGRRRGDESTAPGSSADRDGD
jgi:hypothetical protein